MAEMNWNIRGNDMVRHPTNFKLAPENLQCETDNYQAVFGTEFSFRDLLKIYEIKAISDLAAAVIDAPEFLSSELRMMINEMYGG